tara:strand:+ start:159 stop:605 length:447 start_codon:yes stop_codon:yes gene_type:complete
MKKIGEYTVLGQMDRGTVERVTLFDGRFDTGYRVVEVKTSLQDALAIDQACIVTLATEEAAATGSWNWQDTRQIAWGSFGYEKGTGGASGPNGFNVVDPDNLIVEDLFIFAEDKLAETDRINYMIVMEKYSFKDWDGALAMVRNRAQG